MKLHQKICGWLAFSLVGALLFVMLVKCTEDLIRHWAQSQGSETTVGDSRDFTQVAHYVIDGWGVDVVRDLTGREYVVTHYTGIELLTPIQDD